MNNPINQNQNSMEFFLLLSKKAVYQFKKHKWWLIVFGILSALIWYKASKILMSAQYSTKSLLKVEIAEDSFTRTRYDRFRVFSI